MESEKLLTLFSGEIEHRDGAAIIQLPDRELDIGPLEAGGMYQVAVYSHPGSASRDTATTQASRQRDPESPPASEDDVFEVEIEDIGEQGDGLARIGQGYIVFVPETDIGDRVKVRITEAKENVAFATVLEEEPIK